MENLEVISFSLYKMDVDKTAHETVHFTAQTDGVTEYVKTVLEGVLASSKTRQFKFLQEGDSVPLQLIGILNDRYAFEINSEEIVKKLHSVEVKIQSKIAQMNRKVKEGAFFQIFIKHNELYKYLMLKIDNNGFLDLDQLIVKAGLPSSKNRTQKAAVVTFDNGKISELLLSDSKTTITPYWYNEFLCAVPINSSEKNTKNSFSIIDTHLNKIKEKSKFDYFIIRNIVINYYRNHDEFVFDDLVERVREHRVENNEVLESYFPQFVKEFDNLRHKNKFDTHFDLTRGIIKAKLYNVSIFLDENFDLKVKGTIDDLRSKFGVGEDYLGKYVKIYSDEGYDNFDSGEL